jgi:hypothetical protein
LRLPADFTDGTSNTILIVEAATPVPWTKPEDLPYVADQALPKFGGLFGGDFHALFADGGVQLLSKKADEENLRAAITRNGGEQVDFNKLRSSLAGRGAGEKIDPQQLARENEQLKEAVDKSTAEVQALKEDLEVLKTKLARGTDVMDAKTVKLLQQNAELQEKLGQILSELDGMKAEKARLEKELDKRLREKK